MLTSESQEVLGGLNTPLNEPFSDIDEPVRIPTV